MYGETAVYRVSFEWQDGKLLKLAIKSNNGGMCALKLGKTDVVIKDSSDMPLDYFVENDKIKFLTTKGMTYKVLI